MEIPKFRATAQQLQVPSLNNIQENQNEQIYSSLAKASQTAVDISTKMYEAEQEYKAQVEGAKVNKDTDLTQLSTPRTRGQAVYNNAAIEAFNSSFQVDATRNINELEAANKENPAMFLAGTDAYLKGTMENVPEHLQGKILKPMQMVVESKYANMLSAKNSRNARQSEDLIKYNFNKQREQISQGSTKEERDMLASVYIASLDRAINNGVPGIDYEYIEKSKIAVAKTLASHYLNEELFMLDRTPLETAEILKRASVGKTGYAFLDELDAASRNDIIANLNADNQRMESSSAVRAENIQKVYNAQEAYETIEIFRRNGSDYEQDFELTEIVKEASVGNPFVKKLVREYRMPTYESKEWALDVLDSEIVKGTLSNEQIERMFTNEVISANDFIKYYEANTTQSFELKSPNYQMTKQEVNEIFADRVDAWNNTVEINNYGRYITKGMNTFMKTRPSEDAIIKKYNELKESAKNLYPREFESVRNEQWLYKGTELTDKRMKNLVSRNVTSKGTLDKAGLYRELSKMTDGDEKSINMMYSKIVGRLEGVKDERQPK